MTAKQPKPKAKPVDDVFTVRLQPEDRECFDALRAALAGPVGEPTYADVVRFAIREAFKGVKKETTQ